MFGTIIGLITGLGGPLLSLGSQIVDLQKVKADAKTQVEKAKIEADIEAIHDRRAVLIAEAGNRLAAAMNSSMRLVYALPGAIIVWKLMFDHVIGSIVGCSGKAGALLECAIYRTDPISDNEWKIIMAAAGFYFVTEIVNKIKS